MKDIDKETKDILDDWRKTWDFAERRLYHSWFETLASVAYVHGKKSVLDCMCKKCKNWIKENYGKELNPIRLNRRT